MTKLDLWGEGKTFTSCDNMFKTIISCSDFGMKCLYHDLIINGLYVYNNILRYQEIFHFLEEKYMQLNVK